jgi:hypothetical protein
MTKFKRNEQVPEKESERILSKEELDTKHQAALEANTIISWKSPVRVFKARSRQYFVKIGLYGLVFMLAAIAFGEFLLVGVILAVIFLVYVLASVAPETIEHKITSMGIISGGKAFLWDDLDSFWFEKKGDDRLLVVQTMLHFPSRLIVILTTVSEQGLLDILEKHLHYHHGPVHTLFDKWANYLQSRINFE